MRILYICPDLGIPVLGRKGASVHVRSLSNAFARAGHSVVLAAPILNKSPWDEPAGLAAPLFHLPPAPDETTHLALEAFNELLGVSNSIPGEIRRILYNEEMLKRLKRRFVHHLPDLIYERASLYSTVGILLGRELNRPVIIELNAPLAIEQSKYRATGFGELAAQAECWSLKRADTVITVSNQLRDYVISIGVDPGKVHVFPNGVDTELFRPAPPDPGIRARWGLGNNPVIGFTGGLRPWHGVDALPELLERLVKKYRCIRMIIVGDGPLRSNLEENLRARDLLKNTVFTGQLPHEDVAGLVRQFDVALAPYPRLDHDFYFSPLKIFEYMACGRTVVAAALGQISEIVRNNETGVLYPAGDMDALFEACDRLLADSTLRERIGQAAMKEVHDKFTWDHNAARTVDLARSVIEKLGIEQK